LPDPTLGDAAGWEAGLGRLERLATKLG